MRILVLHNRYQHPGGEDAVVQAEVALLRDNGHTVHLHEADNQSIEGQIEAFRAALSCVWSFSAARDVRTKILQYHPDIVHVHNFFPRLSPSVHFSSVRCGVPVVQTLHNYRLLCPASTLSRDGRVCEDCLNKMYPWPAITHECYHHSRMASGALANMIFIHRVCATLNTSVSGFIALSEFARAKFIAAGLPGDRVTVKPNFVNSRSAMGDGKGKYALFVGRLAAEKGIGVLLKAWTKLNNDLSLLIAGDGPLASQINEGTAAHRSIQWLGWRSQKEVSALMEKAKVLILPSLWYEGFPLVVVEAFAAGLPVIASRIGTLAEVVTDRRTGLLFPPGNADDLAQAVNWSLAHPSELEAMRFEARREFDTKYTPKVNYEKLMRIYRSVCHDFHKRPDAVSV